MLPRLLTGRLLAVAAAAAAAAVTLAAPPASAATGPGASVSVLTRVDDQGDGLKRAGNLHIVRLGVDDNPEGAVVAGEITSYDCEPGPNWPPPGTGLYGECDRVAYHRLAAAGPVSIRVSSDGSAQLTTTVAEVRIRDGRQLRVLDVDVAVTPGNLTLRRNCVCSVTGPNGTAYTQDMFVKQWTGNTASGTIGVFELVPGPGVPTAASSSKYWVSSSVLFSG
jgi:hypothetical protein